MTEPVKPLSENTIKTYNSCLKRLDEEIDDFDYQENPKKVINYIKTKYPNLSSTKTYLCSVMYRVKDKSKKAYDEYKAFMDSLRPVIHKEQTNQLLTKEKEDDYIKWDTLKKCGRDAINMYNQGKLLYSDALVCVLYTEQVPVRADYSNMVFIKDIRKASDTTKNYCLLRVRNPVFIFNEYKTSKSYGKVVIKMKPFTYNVLRERYQEQIDNGDNYIFSEADQTNFSRKVKQAFKKVLNNGKEPTINTIRHSFLTSFLKTNPTIREKEKISQLMMNDLIQQERYKVLNEDDLDKETIDYEELGNLQ